MSTDALTKLRISKSEIPGTLHILQQYISYLRNRVALAPPLGNVHNQVFRGCRG